MLQIAKPTYSSRWPWGLAMSALLTTQHRFYVEGSAEVRHSVRASKQTARRLRWGAAALGGLLLLAVAAAFVALMGWDVATTQASRADRRTRIADARRLASQ